MLSSDQTIAFVFDSSRGMRRNLENNGWVRMPPSPFPKGGKLALEQIPGHLSLRMAKVYFYYSAMNAGKSTMLLQSSYNYQERGMETLRLTPEIDQRAGYGKIASRIGLSADAHIFPEDENLLKRVQSLHAEKKLGCVLIDEAQFLTESQVSQLCDVADLLNIPVLCYGLRTDFQGKLFPGSAALLGWSDNLIELKTICHCGRKATMNMRTDPHGRPIRDGAQVEIGGNDRYVALCRKHYHEAMRAKSL
jgi:thymidine kinase